MPGILDPKLLDALDRTHPETFDGDVWRVAWKHSDPTAGSAGGGRWAPMNHFEVLYTSLNRDGAIAEVYNLLTKAPVMSSSDKTVNRIHLNLSRVANLDLDLLKALGIEEPLANRPDYPLTQAVGEAAYMLDFEAMIVPSARWRCENLVLFLDRIDLNSQLDMVETSDLNWPAWVEQNR